MNALAAVLLAAATGTGSALLPVINAEVYAVGAAGRSHPALAMLLVIALAAGQTTGKLILFETARLTPHLPTCLASRLRLPTRTSPRRSQRIAHALRTRRTAAPLVLLSAGLGLPPLAAVSLAAGASGQNRWEFALLCLLGRTARFTALALPVAYTLH